MSKKITELQYGEALTIPADSGAIMVCCDCGLVHVLINKGDVDAVVEVYRDDRRTGQYRRYKHGNLQRATDGWIMTKIPKGRQLVNTRN